MKLFSSYFRNAVIYVLYSYFKYQRSQTAAASHAFEISCHADAECGWICLRGLL